MEFNVWESQLNLVSHSFTSDYNATPLQHGHSSLQNRTLF